jgi:hypothetical protein
MGSRRLFIFAARDNGLGRDTRAVPWKRMSSDRPTAAAFPSFLRRNLPPSKVPSLGDVASRRALESLVRPSLPYIERTREYVTRGCRSNTTKTLSSRSVIVGNPCDNFPGSLYEVDFPGNVTSRGSAD